MEKSNRLGAYEQFSRFLNPCFALDVRMDVTAVVAFSKSTGTSFFINALYLAVTALHEVEEMRYRIEGGEVYCYDTVDPGYTVMTDNGAYRNCRHAMTFDYKEFYERCQEAMDHVRSHPDSREFSSGRYDEIYFTCVPWTDFTSLSQPLPLGDASSLSIPRIAWGRYVEEDGRMRMTVNMTLDHALMDGEHASRAFALIQKRFDDPGSFIDRA